MDLSEFDFEGTTFTDDEKNLIENHALFQYIVNYNMSMSSFRRSSIRTYLDPDISYKMQFILYSIVKSTINTVLLNQEFQDFLLMPLFYIGKTKPRVVNFLAMFLSQVLFASIGFEPDLQTIVELKNLIENPSDKFKEYITNENHKYHHTIESDLLGHEQMKMGYLAFMSTLDHSMYKIISMMSGYFFTENIHLYVGGIPVKHLLLTEAEYEVKKKNLELTKVKEEKQKQFDESTLREQQLIEERNKAIEDAKEAKLEGKAEAEAEAKQKIDESNAAIVAAQTAKEKLEKDLEAEKEKLRLQAEKHKKELKDVEEKLKASNASKTHGTTINFDGTLGNTTETDITLDSTFVRPEIDDTDLYLLAYQFYIIRESIQDLDPSVTSYEFKRLTDPTNFNRDVSRFTEITNNFNILMNAQNKKESDKTEEEKNSQKNYKAQKEEIDLIYSALKGPVRVFLILRPFVEKLDNDETHPMYMYQDYIPNPAKDALRFNISPWRPTNAAGNYTGVNWCIRNVDELIKQQIVVEDLQAKYKASFRPKQSFSKIYIATWPDGTDDNTLSEEYRDYKNSTRLKNIEIFNEMKPNFDRVIGETGYKMSFLAFGPSGSGKTRNLIGDVDSSDESRFYYGLMYDALKYITSHADVDKITISSQQTYHHNNVFQKDSKTRYLDTLKLYNKFETYGKKYELLKDIADPAITSQGLHTNLEAFFNESGLKGNLIYKYTRDNEFRNETITDKGKYYVGNFITPERYFEDDFEDLKTKTIKQLFEYLKGPLINQIMPLVPVDDITAEDIEAYVAYRKFQSIWNKESQIRDDQFALKADVWNNIISYATGVTLKHMMDLYETDGFKNNSNFFSLRQSGDYLSEKNGRKFFDTAPVTAVKMTEDGKRAFKVFLYYYSKLYTYGNVSFTRFDTHDHHSLIKKTKINKFNDPLTKIELTREKHFATEETTILENTITKLITAINHARPARGTPNNKDSSRSHLCIKLEIHKGSDVSYLNVLDLAGNEGATENYGIMRLEGYGINSSLKVIKEILLHKQDNKTHQLPNSTVNDVYIDWIGAGGELSSLYLNLPSFLKEKHEYQCKAVADALQFTNELQETTKIEEELHGIKQKLVKHVPQSKGETPEAYLMSLAKLYLDKPSNTPPP
jgi:hypothetical protein